jgi:excisionase family DNA binding protein
LLAKIAQKGGDDMEIYTLKQAARTAKIGVETLKRACEEGLLKASQLPNRQWRIAESALEEAMHKGLDFRGLTRRGGKKRPQPEGLRRAQMARHKAARQMS